MTREISRIAKAPMIHAEGRTARMRSAVAEAMVWTTGHVFKTLGPYCRFKSPSCSRKGVGPTAELIADFVKETLMPPKAKSVTPTVFYRTVNVEGLEIFYREAGPRDAPTVL